MAKITNSKVDKNSGKNAAPTQSVAIPITDRIDLWLMPKIHIIAWVLVGITALFGALLFDTRLSFATDDATYVANALSVIANRAYPTYQGSLYPFFLVMLIKVFGVKLLLFKFASFVLMIGQQILLYYTLRKRIPALFLCITMAVFAFNAYILVYGSSTFTESFFMFMQTLSFWAFFKLIDKIDKPGSKLAQQIPYWIIFSICFLLLTITKNVALFAAVAFVAYFAFRKQWMALFLAIGFFVVTKVAYELSVRVVFGNVTTGQIEQQLRKKHDDPSQGYDNVNGFINRYTTNFGQYVSIHIYKTLGIRGTGNPTLFTTEKSTELDPQKAIKPNALLSIMFLIVFILALWVTWRQNKYLFYILLYVGALCNVSFLIQTYWNQDRYVIIFLPFLLAGVVYGLDGLGRMRKLPILSLLGVVLAGLVLIIEIGTTLTTSKKTRGGFSAALGGNVYHNYDEPTTAYLKAAAWIGSNLPAQAITGTARNREATVFAGNLNFIKPDLKALSDPNMQTPDSIVAVLNRQKITHLLTTGSGLGIDPQLAEFLAKSVPSHAKLLHSEPDGLGDEAKIWELIK
ncbi:MAG: hypothetical protein SGJ04_10470 [Bacteroidota bacterium]|nr:hypothetical protein [Bacteroidota bacterium]